MVFNVVGATAKCRGTLLHVLHEIGAGVFVGKIPPKTSKELWSMICESSKSACAVVSANNELGFRIATHGERRRVPVDNFGIQLISYVRNKK